jgi:hypothetical protein
VPCSVAADDVDADHADDKSRTMSTPTIACRYTLVE